MLEAMNYCKRCESDVPVSQWSRSSRSKTGYQPYCKKCTSAYNKEKAAAREAKDPGYQKRKSAEYRAKNKDVIRARQRAWNEAHREHNREVARKWYYENQDRVVEVSLQSKHGITYDDYKAQLAHQGGGCAICGSDDPIKGKRFAVDHDHTCCPRDKSCRKCRRGLLCAFCNVALGYMKDDPDLLAKAIEYLRRQPGNADQLGNVEFPRG